MSAFSPRYQIPSVVLRQYEKQVVALLSYLSLIVVAMLVRCSIILLPPLRPSCLSSLWLPLLVSRFFSFLNIMFQHSNNPGILYSSSS